MSNEQPPTELSEAVTEVWARLVDRPSINMGDTFFLNGGSSLLAMQLVQELQAAFDVQLRLVDFFETPTPAELSRLVHEALERQLEEMSDAELETLLRQDLP